MTYQEFADKVLEYGKNKGLTDMEVYFSNQKSLNISIYAEEIDNFSLSVSGGVGFRTRYNQQMGYSYAEKIDSSSIPVLVEEAIENALIMDKEDEELLLEEKLPYQEVISYNPGLEEITETEKIEIAKAMEVEAKKLDSRIQSVQYCVYGEGAGDVSLFNSKGLSLKDKSNVAYAYVGVIARENEDAKTGMAFRISNDFSELDSKAIAKEAVDQAISMLGADSIESGLYPVVLENVAAANLLEAFTSIFSAEMVQKNLSLLKGKLGQSIGADRLTIVDDPHRLNGAASTGFDGEGYPTKKLELVTNGVLNTYLHNLKTALKDGVNSTGHASRGSYKSSIGISPTNLYIQEGQHTCDDILATIDKGLMIIDLQGLHSGLNPVSGDFSLSCYGYLIENGKKSKPINQITVSGNILTLFNDIEMIGNDLKFGLPSGSFVGSPTLKIKSLAIAGK